MCRPWVCGDSDGIPAGQAAREALQAYIAEPTFALDDLLNANGYWPWFYESRVRAALREAQHSVSYAPDAEVSIPVAVAPHEPIPEATE